MDARLGLGQPGAGRGRSSYASDLLKIALIGCGGRGTGAANDRLNAAEILGQSMKLVAVADAFEDRARNSLKHLKPEWAAEVDVPQHVDLIKAIKNNDKLNEGWHDAVSSMTAVLGRMATHSGQVVRWDEAVSQDPQESPERIAWDASPRHVPGADGFYPFPIPGQYKPG